ncbi:MAG: glycosyl hydrolase-related protein [candidate division KSB1 bacterium]|nr:glycosyl hydrolase-related protein [candidate division KSB1 bacterium]
MNHKRIFHVISNTHWDREWRFPFQKNRQMLVEMMDRLLEILENEPEYRCFHLDSQSIVLEDYLQIRPQQRATIKRLVQQRRLLIGPWFILPDEFQVGGENLIRNLLLGHKICHEFGHVMKVGYSPFSWGQISQLPQIYQEFGIDVVMFYRGINSLDSPNAEFIWEGADGTRVLASRFSTMPRYNFYFYIYRPVIHNEPIADIEYHWTKGGLPFHFADAELKEEDYNLLQPIDGYYAENLSPAIAAIIKNQVNDFTTPHIFWAEGHDSSGPNIKTVRIIEDARKLLPQDEVIHSTLENYAQGLKTDIDLNRLPVVRGERRSSQYDRRSGNLYGYTTSARMYIKQANFATEKWLQFYAEPFNSLAAILGLDIDDRYLDLAWHLLLQNSAHDSIGGCSLDEIHDDMMNRYKQSQEISKGVFARAAKHLSQRLDLKSYPANSIHLVAINPTTYERDEIVEAFIDVPMELDQGAIAIHDNIGQSVPFQLIDVMATEPVLEQMIDRPMYFKMKRYHGFLAMNNVPSLGLKSLHVQPTLQYELSNAALGRIEAGLPVLENEWLRVRVNRNGTLDVWDKNSGARFTGIGYFYDEGEAGHAWVHTPVAPFIDSQTATPSITLDLNGPLIVRVKIRYEIALPATLEERQSQIASATLPIELQIILTKNSRRVEFEIELDNPAESHRLRMMFPTRIDAQFHYGEGQFDVVARPIHRPDTKDWLEQPMYDFPMHHFIDVSDNQIGAAILVDGLKEYEVFDDDQRTIAITLFRAFHYVIQPSSVQDYGHQKGSQCLGQHCCRLAFYPHLGNWEQGLVYREALSYNNELRLIQIGRATGDLAPETSFVRVQPDNLIFSCFKPAEDRQVGAFILRLYNPTNAGIQGTISLYFGIKAAYQVTLEEKFIKKVKVVDQREIEIMVPKKKILTLKLIVE